MPATPYQVLHGPAGLQVRLVLGAGAPADTPARVTDALARELRAAGAAPPPIRVTPVPRIEREASHGAKIKLVKALG